MQMTFRWCHHAREGMNVQYEIAIDTTHPGMLSRADSPRSQQPIGNKKFYFVREDSSVTRATAPADGTTDLQKGVLIGSLRLRIDLDYLTDGHRFAGISLCISRHVTTVRGT